MKHYVCTVGFETEKVDKDGNFKEKKSKYLVHAESLYEALMNILEYLKTDSRGYDVKSIVEAKYEDVVEEKAGKKPKAAVAQTA
jgi:hypothetical protein